jgi:GT2 family glycosyltransferase
MNVEQQTTTIEDTGVSVVLGSYNRRRFLEATIESIRNNGISVPYEIIVVDGGSTDGSLAYLVRQKDVVTIVQHNRGEWRGQPVERRSWGSFMNLAFKCARGKFICMISDDSLLVPGSVMAGITKYEEMHTEGQKVGAVAFYWREWPDDSKYYVGLIAGDTLFVNHGLFLREAVGEVGWIEEAAYNFYHADGDLCLKLWSAGYKIIDCPQAFVEHFRHASTGIRKRNREIAQMDWQTFIDRWHQYLGKSVEEMHGSAKFLEYDDPYRTVDQFPQVDVLKFRLWEPVRRTRKAAGRLKRQIINRTKGK